MLYRREINCLIITGEHQLETARIIGFHNTHIPKLGV
jgi:hypothetical protein